MSGVVALLARDGSAAPTGVLRDATERLAAYGPDGTGHWTDGPVALGHQLLAATPEAETVAHPVVRGDLAVTADVRLDDRPELLDALDVDDDAADAELLLAAYERWGEACPEHLVGAFAFALWDGERERLFCARDHIGIRPLYVAEGDDLVAVATAAPALLALPGVDGTPDDHRIGDYLAGRYPDGPRSFFAGLERLPPAHAAVVDRADDRPIGDGVRRREYWSLADVEPLASRSRAHYERRFRELFERAVADRLRAPGRVGSLLSGGLDSSSVACVAGRLREDRGGPPLPTFSAVFESVTACDESEYVDAVVEGGGFEPHRIRGDGFGPLADLDATLARRGEPFYPALFMLLPRLFAAAADEDVGVVVQGFGGDQVLGTDVRGYLRWLLRHGRFRRLVREVRGYRQRKPWKGLRDVLWDDLLVSLAPGPVRRLRHAAFDDGHYLDSVPSPIDPSFARRTGLDGRLRRDALAPAPRSESAVRRQGLTNGQVVAGLETTDAIAATHGVEPRYPLLDVRLVEFVVGLPPGATVRDGLDRTILRDGLAADLPQAVRERGDKVEFSPNVYHGLRQYDLDTVEATLAGDSGRVGSYLDRDELSAAFERVEAGDGSVGDARTLLTATTVERWLREWP